ncbi:hypothetical protein LIER_14265 [Lithospermum erythrorhizon]|uniref:Phytocyanin domain-containing protein n=1 Tax=Lithospermum erythrorhizon TaxID=34254 RepID=A0AAV3PZH8_LITER
MEGMRKMVYVVGCLMMFFMVQNVSAVRYTVGGNKGWSPNVNYTLWANATNFYNGDWLFFVYDRYQQNVLEVNRTDFESCNAEHFLQNWTTGAGRDVVPLNVTKTYYFISGKGFCYSGMKVAIPVSNPPPPPSAAPMKSTGVPRLLTSFRGRIRVSTLFAIAAVWDAFIFLW